MKITSNGIASYARIFAIFVLLFVSCNANSKNEANESSSLSEQRQNSIKNGLELVDVTRFFNQSIEAHDLEQFHKNELNITAHTIRLNESEVHFTREKLHPHKILGKGSLYEYFKQYISDKYNLQLGDEVTYLNVNYEDVTKEPFKRFFLGGESAIILKNYLFLYTNDFYLLTYKLDENVVSEEDKIRSDYLFSSALLPYQKTIDITKVNYQKIRVKKIEGVDDFACGEQELRYILLDKDESLQLILVPMDCGDFSYRFYLLSIKENKLIAQLYVEGEAYEPDNDKIREKTSFTIDKNSIITVKTSNRNFEKGKDDTKKYKVLSDGLIVELKTE